MLDLHLQEIEDAAARSGVNAFKTQMEIVVLTLLDKNRDRALVQIESARIASLDYVENLVSASLSTAESVKSGRVARAMLAHSFGRLRAAIGTPDGDDFIAKAH